MKVETIERTMAACRCKGWSKSRDAYDRLLFVLGLIERELKIQRQEQRTKERR
jgi:hypothetical protein